MSKVQSEDVSCEHKRMYPTEKRRGANPCPSSGTLSNSKTTTTTITTGTKIIDAKTNDSNTSLVQGRFTSVHSSSLDSTITAPLKPHTGGDVRWDAIQLAKSRECPLGISNFRLLKRLGFGDIGSVYLVELRGTDAFFAMKVMDKASLASRNKLLRAETEREILGLLDHPFLPTLYSYFETDKFYCLVMEFCSGGNLHSLRQKQPQKYFSEQAARLVSILVNFFSCSLISFYCFLNQCACLVAICSICANLKLNGEGSLSSVHVLYVFTEC